MPYKNMLWNAVTYEVNHMRVMIKRVDYGFFSWLGDIGGLSGIFFSSFSLVLGWLLGDTSTLAIAKELTSKDDDSDDKRHSSVSCCLSLKINCSWLFCGKICHRNRREVRL